MKTGKVNWLFIEAVVFAACFGLFLYVCKDLLVLGASALVHDHVYWGYPVYHFYAQNILNWTIPLWDPYIFGGEPVYPLFVVSRFIGPVPLAATVIGGLFTRDTTLLYSWSMVSQMLVMTAGTYLVFRKFAETPFVRLLMLPVLFLSSMMFVSFRQMAMADHMMFVPLMFLFLLNIVYWKDTRWHNWILAALLLGLNWESYFFAGAWVFLLVFLASIAVFRRDLIPGLVRSRGFVLKSAVFSAIVILMMLPNFAVLKESKKFFYPARKIPIVSELLQGGVEIEKGASPDTGGVFMAYSDIAKTGAHSTIWDIAQAFTPEANWALLSPDKWGDPSEAYIYIGILPFIMAVAGVFMGRHDLKRPMLMMAAVFWLLSLGPAGFIHRVLYYIYPPLWGIRNMHAMSLFFVFMLMYFFVLGMNRAMRSDNETPFEIKAIFSKRFTVATSFALVFAATVYLSFHALAWVREIHKDNIYTLPIIAACAAFGVFVKRRAGPVEIIAGAITGLALFAAVNGSDPWGLILRIAIYAVLPGVLLIAARKSGRNRMRTVMLVVCFVVVTVDLYMHTRIAEFLYKGHPNLERLNGLNIKAGKPEFPKERRVLKKVYLGSLADVIRYAAHLESRPYMFTELYKMHPLFEGKDMPGADVTSKTIPNASFERWAETTGGWLPEGFSYDGSAGWAVQPNYMPEAVKDGVSSMVVVPAQGRRAEIKLTIDTAPYIGRTMMFAIKVWTMNSVPGSIGMRLDAEGATSDRHYQISNVKIGGMLANEVSWERLYVEKFVTKNTVPVTVTLFVDGAADAYAVFDDMRLYVREPVSDIVYAMMSKDVAYFQMLKNYFVLVNYAGMPPEALAEMFAIMQDPIQFKTGALLIDAGKIEERFRGVNPGRLAELLKERILIEETEAKGLEDTFIMPHPEYEGFMADGGKSGSHVFDYAIESYDFNRLILDVNTDKDGFLYWADGYDEYWHAYVDGAEVPIYRANVNFKAIRINQGGHKVEFAYRPMLFLASIAVFYAVIIASLAAGVLFYVKSRKNN